MSQPVVVTIDVAFEWTLRGDFVREARCQAPECVGAPGARAGVAAVHDHRQVRVVFREFRNQERQLLVGKIESPGTATVEADQAFILAIRVKLVKLLR